MAPPLIQLTDIALTFGGTPLLERAELSVSTGERVSLVGRNGSGKSTLLKIAAGSGRAGPWLGFRAAGSRGPLSAAGTGFLRICLDARLCRGGARAGRRQAPSPQSLGAARADRAGRPGEPVRRRGAPRVARARAGAVTRHPAARRADQSSRPDHHRMAGARPGGAPHRARHHQPRPALPFQPVARHGLARSRPDAPARTRLREVRGMARRHAGRRGARSAQARPPDRRRGALAALRRHRQAQTQRAARRATSVAARAAAHATAAQPAAPTSRRVQPRSPARWSSRPRASA